MVSNCLSHRARGIFCPSADSRRSTRTFARAASSVGDAMTAAFVELPDGASPRVYRTPAGLKNLQPPYSTGR